MGSKGTSRLGAGGGVGAPSLCDMIYTVKHINQHCLVKLWLHSVGKRPFLASAARPEDMQGLAASLKCLSELPPLSHVLSSSHLSTDTSKTCYQGNGHSYRGKANTDSRGRPCLAWNSANVLQKAYHAQRPDALQLGLGKHNYCR